MRMVTLVLRLTPIGVFALITQVLASSSLQDILNLIGFVMASYSALILMFCVHLLIIAAVGLNPGRYVKKIFPVLAFAFTSRTSAGSIPMSVQTQTARLGTPEGIANFAASFGSMMGQNGCAGIYPAMLAVMIAPSFRSTARFRHCVIAPDIEDAVTWLAVVATATLEGMP